MDRLLAAVVPRHLDPCGAPATSSTRSASISRLITNALPVWRWQFRQWQQWTKSGSDVSRYRTSPHAHPPSLMPRIKAKASLGDRAECFVPSRTRDLPPMKLVYKPFGLLAGVL